MLYFSDWLQQAVLFLDLTTMQLGTVFSEKGLTPADIALAGNTLLIPNMLHQEIIMLNLDSGEVKRIR